MAQSADAATHLLDVPLFEREIFLERRGGHRAANGASRTRVRRHRRSGRTEWIRRAFVAEVDPNELPFAGASLAQGSLEQGTEPRRLLRDGAGDDLHRERDADAAREEAGHARHKRVRPWLH